MTRTSVGSLPWSRETCIDAGSSRSGSCWRSSASLPCSRSCGMVVDGSTRRRRSGSCCSWPPWCCCLARSSAADVGRRSRERSQDHPRRALGDLGGNLTPSCRRRCFVEASARHHHAMQDPEAVIAMLAFASIAVGVLVARARIARAGDDDRQPGMFARMAPGIVLVLAFALSPAGSTFAHGAVVLTIAACAGALAARRREPPVPRAIARRRLAERWRSWRDALLEDLGRATITCGPRHGIPLLVYARSVHDDRARHARRSPHEGQPHHADDQARSDRVADRAGEDRAREDRNEHAACEIASRDREPSSLGEVPLGCHDQPCQ